MNEKSAQVHACAYAGSSLAFWSRGWIDARARRRVQQTLTHAPGVLTLPAETLD
jgi:hypothetical protein